jgi:hypothetical protein
MIVGITQPTLSVMRIIYYLFLFLMIASCSGKEGAVGPKGDKGDTGATGPKGDTGKAGDNGSQAYIYDFTTDVSVILNGYEFDEPIADNEFVFVFLKRTSSSYTALPYNGYAYDVNKKFTRVNFGFEYYRYSLYIDDFGDLPSGSVFAFRAVFMKGIPDGRLNAERYRDYNNLKADFNLPD